MQAPLKLLICKSPEARVQFHMWWWNCYKSLWTANITTSMSGNESVVEEPGKVSGREQL